MSELTRDEVIRCAALNAVSRFSPREMGTDGVLSRASQVETYIRSGVIRTGREWRGCVQTGGEGVNVLVADEHMDGRRADLIRAAVGELL